MERKTLIEPASKGFTEPLRNYYHHTIYIPSHSIYWNIYWRFHKNFSRNIKNIFNDLNSGNGSFIYLFSFDITRTSEGGTPVMTLQNG